MQLREHYPEFQGLGAEILAISNEDQERGAKLETELGGLPFPLLADTERKVIESYGVFHQNEPKGRPISRPATFVVDAAGVIRYRYVGENVTDRPEPQIILAAVPGSEIANKEEHDGNS